MASAFKFQNVHNLFPVCRSSHWNEYKGLATGNEWSPCSVRGLRASHAWRDRLTTANPLVTNRWQSYIRVNAATKLSIVRFCHRSATAGEKISLKFAHFPRFFRENCPTLYCPWCVRVWRLTILMYACDGKLFTNSSPTKLITPIHNCNLIMYGILLPMLNFQSCK